MGYIKKLAPRHNEIPNVKIPMQRAFTTPHKLTSLMSRPWKCSLGKAYHLVRVLKCHGQQGVYELKMFRPFSSTTRVLNCTFIA